MWSFEARNCQGCTEPSRRTTIFFFYTDIRQRRIGGGWTGRKRLNTTPARITFALCYRKFFNFFLFCYINFWFRPRVLPGFRLVKNLGFFGFTDFKNQLSSLVFIVAQFSKHFFIWHKNNPILSACFFSLKPSFSVSGWAGLFIETVHLNHKIWRIFKKLKRRNLDTSQCFKILNHFDWNCCGRQQQNPRDFKI